MNRDTRNSLAAAAWLMIIFGFGAFYMPSIMIAVGNYSTVAAGAIAILYVAAFFMVFWLRGRSQRNKS